MSTLDVQLLLTTLVSVLVLVVLIFSRIRMLPLLALSIGCGSLFFYYANHSGFWLFKESFGMTMGEAAKTILVVQSIVSVVGLTHGAAVEHAARLGASARVIA